MHPGYSLARAAARRALFLVSAWLLLGCGSQTDSNSPTPIERLPSETSVYKKSDIGTDVLRLTTDSLDDRIFYQEPSSISPDGSLLLFQSARTENMARLHILDLETGEIRRLRNNPSFGYAPTWSRKGNEVLIGETGEILIRDAHTLKQRVLALPHKTWISFLRLNPSGSLLAFIEEDAGEHVALSVIDPRDGTGFRRIYTLDQKTEFFVDKPIFLNDSALLFLTRGKDRDFRGAFNQPFVMTLGGVPRRIPRECSHYDVHPAGGKILCGQEGYILDLNGNILQEIPGLHGHGTWSPDGQTFLMTGDPVPVPVESPYFGKIVTGTLGSSAIRIIVGHESSYNSASDPHVQPNAQFSRDGNSILYESDRGTRSNTDLFLVRLK